MAAVEEFVAETQKVIEQIREMFRTTEHPGDAFLQESQDGCEPAESGSLFKGVGRYTNVAPTILDQNHKR
jgi:hypothetical protein